MVLRSKTVHFRVTAEEYQKLEDTARGANTTVSWIARKRVLSPPQDPQLVLVLAEVRFIRLMLLTLFEQLGKGQPLVGKDLDNAVREMDALKLPQALRVMEGAQNV